MGTTPFISHRLASTRGEPARGIRIQPQLQNLAATRSDVQVNHGMLSRRVQGLIMRQLNVRLLLAFFAIYVVWGSTYLAIRITV